MTSKNENKNIQLLLDKEREDHLKTKIKLNARELELHVITQSVSYKLAKKIALVKHLLKKTANHARSLNPKELTRFRNNLKYVNSIYTSQEFNEGFSVPPTSTSAVVLHLYYPDLLDYFKERLSRLKDFSFDMFITLPNTKRSAIPAIKVAFPGARIIVVPNSGRDVLPFIEVTRWLNILGYKQLLKLHSKKSPHRKDGDIWRDSIVNSLIPSNKKDLDEIIDRLSDPRTALIGPKNEYVSFLVNYHSTAHHTKRIVSKLFSEKRACELEMMSDEYGFFAGTMFWARIEALMPVVNSVKLSDFEVELGQEDSTTAHALERLFCVLPELKGLKIYGYSSEGLTEMDYHTVNIPEWSDFAIRS